jgi:hypothetical protein
MWVSLRIAIPDTRYILASAEVDEFVVKIIEDHGFIVEGHRHFPAKDCVHGFFPAQKQVNRRASEELLRTRTYASRSWTFLRHICSLTREMLEVCALVRHLKTTGFGWQTKIRSS